MPSTFKLDDHVTALAFEGMADYGLPDGAVPEPSDEAFRAWRDALNRSVVDSKVELPDDPSIADIAEASLAGDGQRIALDVVDAYARLCGGFPPDRPRPIRPELRGDPLPEPADYEGPTRYAEPTPAQVKKHAAAVKKYEEDLQKWFTEWTGEGNPTRAQIAGLPYRYQRAFFGWLVGEFLNPESSPVATSS